MVGPFLAAVLFAQAAFAQTIPPRWVLVYSGGPQRPAYAVPDLVDLIGVVDTAGKPTGWLFSGILMLEFRAVSSRYYMPTGANPPSTGDDWRAYLDSVFATRGPLVRADSAAAVLAAALGPADHRLDVAVMIPFPDPRADSLVFMGHKYSMASKAGRSDAVAAYLREARARFSQVGAVHLHLGAFYWLNESIEDADTALVRDVASAVHGGGNQFLWIPFFTARGASNWRSLGFDQAWLQPNYFFHPDVPALRVDSAVARATAGGMGLEVEFDKRMFGSWQYKDRLEPYLAALEGTGALRGKPIAVYEGAGALIQLARSHDPWYRSLYARLTAALTAPVSAAPTQ